MTPISNILFVTRRLCDPFSSEFATFLGKDPFWDLCYQKNHLFKALTSFERTLFWQNLSPKYLGVGSNGQGWKNFFLPWKQIKFPPVIFVLILCTKKVLFPSKFQNFPQDTISYRLFVCSLNTERYLWMGAVSHEAIGWMWSAPIHRYFPYCVRTADNEFITW